MDIRSNQPGPERARRAYEEQQRALVNANRAIVRAAREGRLGHAEELRAELKDALELSAAAQAAQEPSPAEREARVRELTEAHRLGQLHTPERLEQAAHRLLGG